jgi:hypothetical protein
MFNFSMTRRGGLRFIKLGRFFFCFALCAEYRPLRGQAVR